jgi:hypothetical protein
MLQMNKQPPLYLYGPSWCAWSPIYLVAYMFWHCFVFCKLCGPYIYVCTLYWFKSPYLIIKTYYIYGAMFLWWLWCMYLELCYAWLIMMNLNNSYG